MGNYQGGVWLRLLSGQVKGSVWVEEDNKMRMGEERYDLREQYA